MVNGVGLGPPGGGEFVLLVVGDLDDLVGGGVEGVEVEAAMIVLVFRVVDGGGLAGGEDDETAV